MVTNHICTLWIGLISIDKKSTIPFSHLPWKWRIGPDYFEHIDALDHEDSNPPIGIVDDLSAYATDSCHIERLKPSIRAFYENTQSQVLMIYPEWHWLFRWPARIYKFFSRQIGQMNLPLRPDNAKACIKSDIVPLRDSLDGRQNVRGWIRVFETTQEAVYVAAYATHFDGNSAYMNIAFPLPLGNLTSILYMVTFESQSEVNLRLSSFSKINPGGHQGVYFATRWFVLRLPFNETIEVFPVPYDGWRQPTSKDEHEIFTRHHVWIFGFHFLTLHYGIHKIKSQNPFV